MNFIPIRDYLVVIKDEDKKEKRTSSGLYLAPEEEEKIVTGIVSAAGSGRVTMSGAIIPLDVSSGDRVAFNRNNAIEVKYNNEIAWLLREDQVVCKLSV